MSGATISVLPVWKKDSTPAEWLQEIAAMALVHPERFAKIVVIYDSEIDEVKRQTIMRYNSYGLETNREVLGHVEAGKLEVYEQMKGRRE